MKKGKLEWISFRPDTRNLEIVDQINVSVENGLEGDHYSKKNGKRQVTIIQKEHLITIASFLNKEEIDPAMTRRNLIASGLNLLAQVKKQIRIGNDVVLEITGDCPPCGNMDANLGEGGCDAMIGIGGVTARVVQGGVIKKGDDIVELK